MEKERNEELKIYQRHRAAKRRACGLVSRTIWIREEDDARFREQVEGLVDHARLIEAVTGGPPLTALEIHEIIHRHRLSYDPADLIFLARIRESIALDPSSSTIIKDRAQEILEQYHLPVSLNNLLD